MYFEDDDTGWVDEPDAVALVVECADLRDIFAADQVRRVEAYRAATLAEASVFDGALDSVLGRSMRLELAAALRITENAAAELLWFAESLVNRYPAVLDSLSRAALTERHAQALVSILDAAPADVREALTARAVALAEELPVGAFRRRLRRLIEGAQASTLTERHEEAISRRRVVVEKVEDGMSWLHIFGPSVEIHAVHGRMTAMAKVLMEQEGDDRTLDQARADVVCDLLIEGEMVAHPDRARGIRATVIVTVPVLSLLDDAHATTAPASVEGIGPIPIDRARELVGDADSWMRVLTHPETGMVLSVGRVRYRPPEALQRLVRWRAERCMGPGCGMPAARCQIDHSIAWEYGGETALWNTAPLCLNHHIVKHHGGWGLHQLPDGSIEWTSPTGRRYIERPERRVPVFREAA